MNIIALIVALMLILSFAAGAWFWCYFLHKWPSSVYFLPFMNASYRKLAPEERAAVEYYLNQQNELNSKRLSGTHALTTTNKIVLAPQSNKVYSITHAITRYNLASDAPNKWRYYINNKEVHLPLFWEPYISTDNQVEIIKTQTIPLVISLNGHSLVKHMNERSQLSISSDSMNNASIRKEESEHVELINIRKETKEEHVLNRPSGVLEATIISISLLLLFFSLISPINVIPWMIFIAVLITIWASWSLLRQPSERELSEIHCLRGTPKGWGLFGESNRQSCTVSLGNVDLIYPSHWQPYIARELGKVTDVDIYLNRQVVRQGHYLSLHDEVKHFPLQLWWKNAVLAIGATLVLTLLLVYIPLTLPLKLSIAWLQGAQKSEVVSVDALKSMQLYVGNTLKIQGHGMCFIPPQAAESADIFMPFDCSKIYWNNISPPLQPESHILNQAASLLENVKQQLHPEGDNTQRINPQLASAIEKSGMILLNDFATIVLKTAELCINENDCTKLKNALVNLDNAKSWPSLVKRAKSGALKGMNVLLRPANAESLEELIKSTTFSFIQKETDNAIELMRQPHSGGFLITSDEGKKLVNIPTALINPESSDPFAKWNELKQLTSLLLNTPFQAQGVITNISTDANGTKHIALHSEPDIVTLWRYLGTTLLLVLASVFFIYNFWRLIQRYHLHRQRIVDIKCYYDQCFSQQSATNFTYQKNR